MTENKFQKRPPSNKWLAFINIPIQMGIIVYVFAFGGKWLDAKYSNSHQIFVKILTLLGVAIAFYNLNRQLKDINQSDDKK